MGRELENSTILKQFVTHFNTSPTVLIKAPGRVNLIGEHTDYNGLPVLPISIPFTIAVAVSPRGDDTVSIANSDNNFEPSSFTVSRDIPHSEPGEWANYVKAAVNELVSRSNNQFRGMNALFHGDIPNSAGLSSSSALVVASALSLLAANRLDMDRIELADAMAYGEHYVGTQGGGMDQAICLLGRAGNAVKIDFFPLSHTYVPFPDGYSIIVAHSMVRAAKTENALLLYNRRPAECRLATALINALYQPDQPLTRLGDLKNQAFYKDFDSPEDFVNGTFDRDSYSLDDVAGITGDTPETITNSCLMTRSGVPMLTPPDGFLIRQRAMHVLTEGERVEKSRAILAKGDAAGFGRLMDESHESCDRQYGLSTPELNELVSIMRSYGALGARLTGAGFGGCAIGLVKDEDAERVMEGIRETYYQTYIPENRPDLAVGGGNDASLLFPVKPSDGASVESL